VGASGSRSPPKEADFCFKTGAPAGACLTVSTLMGTVQGDVGRFFLFIHILNHGKN